MVACRVTAVDLLSIVVLQHAALAAVATVAAVIVTREMVAVGRALPAVATDVAATTGAATVMTDTHADTGAEIDITHPAGLHQNPRTSRSN